ncbi:hypothetical protein WJX81_007299 [Elliptochloris bilobata]|uniref:Radical S-adenosyl methionine domain-containing protein 1, mitochondrial n=1 Tax=Elliptochloris bilobata TaxID=381761 RepID=A0AAW1RCP2_9CHLO
MQCSVAACVGTDLEVPTSAYVHLPFCKRKCFYCDFPVVATGSQLHSAPVQDALQAYVALLCREIAATQPVGGAPLRTVFFGGGTPSLIPPPQLARVLDALAARFGIAAGAEVSMEADPGTFDALRLREYMALGVNRFSIGVQAFQQELLEVCGRSHSLADVHAALTAVRDAAPAAWSLDLMAGLPGLGAAAWEASLVQALAAKPDHISVYDLQVEEGTPFARWYQPGAAPLPGEGAAADQLRAASAVLRAAGYEHYELSSYALPGKRCQHNQVYWAASQPYHAFGLGAASLLGARRFARPRAMRAYRAWVEAFVAAGSGVPGGDQPPDSAHEQLLDYVMLRLRLSDGLDLAHMAARFGAAPAAAAAAALAPHVVTGLAEVAAGRSALWGFRGRR